ncbi:MAG: Fe(3+) ABC transporter substrate-binding protein [Sulfurovum sp.]|nr:Fe(3+) ABC transporter substrate-binding protein [Sulfurovum sp.]
MIKKISIAALLLTGSLMAAGEVNIYSTRHYDADKNLYKMFTEKTGIAVNVVKAKPKALIKRLETEGANTKADLFITADAGNLVNAQKKGLLQPVKSKKIEEAIPETLRQKDGYWVALTQRARIIAYNKEKVKPEDLSTYEDLTDKKWKGRITIRKSSNIYNQSLLASFIATKGPEKAKMWAKGIVDNMSRKPRGNDRDQMKAVAAGVGDIAVVNTYYVGKLLNSKKPYEVEVGKLMGVFFPKDTHVNISGVAMTKNAKNKDNAVKLMEYLVSPDAQKVFASANYEYPANPKVEASDLLKSWGTFEPMVVSLEAYGEKNEEAVKIMNEVEWK